MKVSLRGRWALAGVTCLWLLSSGCEGLKLSITESEPGYGAAHVSVPIPKRLAAVIARVDARVTAVDIDTIRQTLAIGVDSVARGTIAGIPVGTGRSLTLTGVGAEGRVTHAGTVDGIVIEAGDTVEVEVVLEPVTGAIGVKGVIANTPSGVPICGLQVVIGQDYILANGAGESGFEVELVDGSGERRAGDDTTRVHLSVEGPADVVSANPATVLSGTVSGTLRSQSTSDWAVLTASAAGCTSGSDRVWIGDPPPPEGGTAWSEGFEGDALGAFPTAWVADGNATAASTNRTTDVTAAVGAQSLRLFGALGSCWGAIAYRALQVSPPFTVELAFRNGDEELSGCHPLRTAVNLRAGTSWTNPARYLLQSKANGDLETHQGVPLGHVEPLEWHRLKVGYERPSTDEVRITYWLDGQQVGIETLPTEEADDNLTHLDIEANEGSVWYDAIVVSSGV